MKLLRRGFASAGNQARRPVVISGGGPAGLTCALLLGRWKVPCVVVEPLEKPSDHPRAHVLSTRTMEIFREVGVEESIKKLQPPLEEWRRFRYCRVIDEDEDFGVADHASSEAFTNLRECSPCFVTHVSQPKVEAVLRARLASYSDVKTMYGRKITRIDPSGSGSVELDDGTRLDAEYVVGADGPRSVVRDTFFQPSSTQERLSEIVGAPVHGPPLQHFVSMHFQSKELGRRLLESRPAMLYFAFNETGAKVVVAHDLSTGLFNLQVPFFPPFQGPDLNPAGAVASCLSQVPEDVEYGTPRVWTMRAKLDETFSMPEKKAFLIGDSCHEMPPSGGFGLNAAVQDAHNLAWKLARNEQLETYDAERRPAVAATIAVAVDNWRRGLLVPEALGAPSQRSFDFVKRTFSMGFFVAGSDATKAAFNFGSHLVYRAAFRERKPNAAPLDEILRTRRELPLFFPNVDLGAEYDGNSAEDAALAARSKARHESGAQPYEPKFRRGSRLPHFLVGSDDASVSSLDLVAKASAEKPNFVLLVLDPDFKPSPEVECEVVGASPCDKGELVRLLEPGGTTLPAAVLVRPDGYIARVYS